MSNWKITLKTDHLPSEFQPFKSFTTWYSDISDILDSADQFSISEEYLYDLAEVAKGQPHYQVDTNGILEAISPKGEDFTKFATYHLMGKYIVPSEVPKYGGSKFQLGYLLTKASNQKWYIVAFGPVDAAEGVKNKVDLIKGYLIAFLQPERWEWVVISG